MPWWLRLALAVDRWAMSAQRSVRALVVEMALAWTPGDRREAVTAAIYGGRPTYAPGGSLFEGSLFPWEEAVLPLSGFPPGGTILIGGAGGGREMRALAQRGFTVVGFEPSDALVRQGQRAMESLPGATLLMGSYGDLIAAAGGETNDLSPALSGRQWDGVILGWGSLSHVLSKPVRQQLLRAVRRVAPEAPVLLSYLSPEPAAGGRRRLAARALRVAGRPADDNVHFLPHLGFYVGLTGQDIAELADEAGYRVDHAADQPYPHAVLRPR